MIFRDPRSATASTRATIEARSVAVDGASKPQKLIIRFFLPRAVKRSATTWPHAKHGFWGISLGGGSPMPQKSHALSHALFRTLSHVLSRGMKWLWCVAAPPPPAQAACYHMDVRIRT